MIVPRRRRRRPWLGLLVLLLPASSRAVATDYHGALCNASTSAANATGTASFSVGGFLTAQLANGSYTSNATRPLPDPSWLVTIHPEEPLTELWLDTGGQTYWDDVQTQFDACAFIIRGQIPFATMERAQQDSGDCNHMLSLGCRQALKDQVALYAETWIQNSTSDQHSVRVSDICAGIAQSIAWDPSRYRYFPQACSQDFGYRQEWFGPTNTYLPLTGRNRGETSLNPQCPISGPLGKKYYNLIGFTEPTYFDSAARIVTPILTVFFSSPNANSTAQPYPPPSQLSCLRITSFSTGSALVPPLVSGSAAPDPSFANRTTKGLSLAAVLALSLSCVLLVGFLIGFSAFHKWWRSNWRRIEIVDERVLLSYRLERLAARRAVLPASKGKELELEEREPEEVDGIQLVEAPSGRGPVELDATERRPSLVSSRRSLGSFDTCESIEATTNAAAGAVVAPLSPVSPVEPSDA